MNIEILEANFPKSLEVTEQLVDLSTLSTPQKQFYINLLNDLISIYESKQKDRVIIGFSGPSGSGKSVTVEILKELSKYASLPCTVETLGIDAYSYTNDYLLSHYDNEKSLKEHKGRYDTYNVLKLKNDLEDFSKGEVVRLPIYSRKIHNPVENVVLLQEPKTLLLVEGLWLLYDEYSWADINNLLDFSFFVLVEESKVKQLTINRHIKGGRTPEEATSYYENADSFNFDKVTSTAKKADKIIPFVYDI